MNILKTSPSKKLLGKRASLIRLLIFSKSHHSKRISMRIKSLPILNKERWKAEIK